jgi:Uma2 family endonuclease
MGRVIDNPSSAASDVLCAPPVRPLTREEFEQAGNLGIFGSEERLELIGGEVVKKVSPQQPPHAISIGLCAEALRRAYSVGHHVRVQLPLALGPHNEPEPDICVVVGSIRDYEDSHPAIAALVVEVADTSVRFDRSVKASLYASAGIPEYWIVNVADRVIEVHREPAPIADEPFGHQYRSVTRHTEADHISPHGVAEAKMRVGDLLPTARG